MNYGYKARALQSLERRNLPTLTWSSHTSVESAVLRATEYHRTFGGRWALRVDRPVNDGTLLPLFGSNKGTDLRKLHELLIGVKERHPDCTFLTSEAPDDTTRDANAVVYMDGDILFGELSFDAMTLRDAWTRGKLWPVAVDGGVGDFLWNRPMRVMFTATILYSSSPDEPCGETEVPYITPRLTAARVEYLRQIRNIVKYYPGLEFEISIMKSGRIIFWQEAAITENRTHLFRECRL